MQTAVDASVIPLGSRENVISELDDIDGLMSLYRARVLRYVTFSTGDQDLAETITQDCFLKAYNARASFRGDSAVSTWLFSIATNLIRDQVRTKKFQFWRKAKATAVDISEMASFLPSDASSPETTLLARERTKQVGAAVEQLSVNQRKVSILRFSEELEIAEIAEVTGMQVNTVKTHLHRAVTAVRANLGGQT